MRASILNRIARAEVRLSQQRHVGVILAASGDDVGALVRAAVKAGRVAANAALIVLPADVDAATWQADALANARAARVRYPIPPRTFAASAPTAPTGRECTPSDGLARAMIVETVGNVRNNIKFFTTHAAAESACAAMATEAATGARYEVVGLAAPPNSHNRRARG